ncbi:thioredoxin domain-containing protein [Sphingomonas sp. PAMC 26605]|uniref:thioredoxin domain-containing protein n=1 Tax=Sphingomonas sp. PAMC 26605 TaxID=1112214 RepID=UPI001E45E0E1|nr:thioredoxin domain-containing protein [Sphingomonas sp. PAMC 26605]
MRFGLAALVLSAALVSSVQAAPPKKAPAHAAWLQTVVATPEGGVRIGNPAAKVKLIEFGSRTCPHCAKFDAEGFPALKASYIPSGQVSYEFRDFPIHGALDLGPILLGHCVPVRAFFPILDAMMTNQQTLVGRSDQVPDAKQKELAGATPNAVATYLAQFYGYTDLVVKHGLPLAKANACLADRKSINTLVARTDAANKAYAVSSTPTFVLNGAAQASVNDWAGLEPLVRAALAK